MLYTFNIFKGILLKKLQELRKPSALCSPFALLLHLHAAGHSPVLLWQSDDGTATAAEMGGKTPNCKVNPLGILMSSISQHCWLQGNYFWCPPPRRHAPHPFPPILASSYLFPPKNSPMAGRGKMSQVWKANLPLHKELGADVLALPMLSGSLPVYQLKPRLPKYQTLAKTDKWFTWSSDVLWGWNHSSPRCLQSCF